MTTTVTSLLSTDIFTLTRSGTLYDVSFSTLSSGVLSPITNGTEHAAGTLTGAEIIPMAKVGPGLCGTALNNLASFSISTYDGFLLAGSGSGAVARTVESKLSDIISVKDFGATGNGTTDDTAAIQSAINFIVNSTNTYSLFFPDGTYNISATLNIGTDSSADLTGRHIYGQSRGATIINMTASNIPMFQVVGMYVHTFVCKTFTFQYSTMQTGNTSASVFYINGPSGSSFYNSVFSDISANNFYWFMDAPVTDWWGNTYRDMWLGDFAGGINNIQAGAGEPNCKFERIYVTPVSATQPLFNHNAVVATFDAIEVNAANSGATMLYDGGGGAYIIGHWALEVGTYNSNANLWDVPNGSLIMQYGYANTLTIGSGAYVSAFHCTGDQSFIDVGHFSIAEFASNEGLFKITQMDGPIVSHIKNLYAPFGTNCALTDMVSTAGADCIVVDWWNDTSAVSMNTGNVTLSFDSNASQVFSVPLTATTTVTLPESRQVADNQLFTGRRFKISKTNTSAHPLNIVDITGATVATITSGVAGSVEVMFVRDGGATNFSWLVIS